MEDDDRAEVSDGRTQKLRFVCEKEIPIRQQRIEAFALSFSKSLEAIKARVREKEQNKAKTGKEAERMSILDSLATTKSRIEKLRFSLHDQKARRDEYAAIISQKSTVLDCDPPLNGTKEFIQELNKTNSLIKFVRIMREKFQKAVSQGVVIQYGEPIQDFSTVSGSGPGLSASTDRNGSSTKKFEHEVEDGEGLLEKIYLGFEHKSAMMSPASATSIHKSPGLMVKK